MMSKNNYSTRGHHATEPGLRGHSTGEHYPYYIMPRWRDGASGPLEWVVLNLKTGSEWMPVPEYQHALELIYTIKLHGLG